MSITHIYNFKNTNIKKKKSTKLFGEKYMAFLARPESRVPYSKNRNFEKLPYSAATLKKWQS